MRGVFVSRFLICPLATLTLVAMSGRRAASQSASPAPSSGGQTVVPIAASDLRHRLLLVAHDSMGGRSTGSPGHLRVTDYLARELRRLGLQPAGDSGTYFQTLPALFREPDVQLRSSTGLTLTLGRHVRILLAAVTYPAVDSAQVVFGGEATDSTTWITADEARGKFVILRHGPDSPGVSTSFAGKRSFLGAAVVAHTGFGPRFSLFGSGGADLPIFGPQTPLGERQARPATLILSDSVAEQLIGRRISEWTAGTMGRARVHGTIRYSERVAPARNVAAVLPGSTRGLRSRYVALGAHLDHLPPAPAAVDHDSVRAFTTAARRLALAAGRETATSQQLAEIVVDVDSLHQLRPPRRDSIYNGADDNGSGVVALLEIAEALATAAPGPSRSVLFVWHAAEELGLVGAEHFTAHPTVPLDSIDAHVNVDMIGRGGTGEEIGGGPQYLQVIGWRRRSTELGDLIERTNAMQPTPFRLDVAFDAPGHPRRMYCRSDHYMYARAGIPVAYFTTGLHPDYHRISDEPQYIDYEKLTRVTRLVHDVTRALADLDHRVAADQAKPDPTASCRQ